MFEQHWTVRIYVYAQQTHKPNLPDSSTGGVQAELFWLWFKGAKIYHVNCLRVQNLFNDFLCVHFMEREVRAISVNNGWEGIRKEAVMVRFEELL